jgi:Flp pilus assembly protein TadG
MIIQTRLVRLRDHRSKDAGYVAVMTALLLTILMSLAAFAVDVGHWYLVGQQEQRAADAAALAGVTNLPADQAGAFATAGKYAKVNGFAHDPSGTLTDPTTVTSKLDSGSTRLRVTISRTVSNFFGSLMGVPTTTIARTAVADYAGPVPMGSPCNEFGDDPYPSGHRSTNCAYSGQFWANVGSPIAAKKSGDAYQNEVATNTDYDSNGYFYSITVPQAMTNLTIEAFDPAFIDVGDYCGATGKPDPGNLIAAKTLTYPAKAVVSDPATRYANGATPYCTGDIRFGGAGTEPTTQFTVRSPGLKPWDPLSFPAIGGTCTQTFAGYSGDLSKALDKTNVAAYKPDVAANFRQWKTLCTIPSAAKGTYLIQVKTNGVGKDLANGHNRFSLRAYGESSGENDVISLAGYYKMAMYGNTPNGTSTFYLAKVPSSAKGQLFNVRLWDIGDGAVSGSTVKVLPPAELASAPTPLLTFPGCTGAGVTTGALTNCQISVNSSYDGKWQTISVPIPATYTCDDASTTGCWVRLEFFYGTGSTPADTTSWTASIQGDPVRLVE